MEARRQQLPFWETFFGTQILLIQRPMLKQGMLFWPAEARKRSCLGSCWTNKAHLWSESGKCRRNLYNRARAKIHDPQQQPGV